MTTRILSGIRPTGHIHLGNYMGAIRQWVTLSQTIDEHYFCIVDQHALTTVDDAKDLQRNTLTIAAAYIASGINPEKSHMFAQSHVPYHTELSWYFSCITPLGWLNRMTQFKDKSGKNKDSVCLGLLAYPVLMAADILLYKATHVPVGDDQKQHVELARDIAVAFNNYAGKDVFNLPEPMIEKTTARIMSLRDGTKKMSKSDLSDYSRIHLLDDSDTIRLKIKKAKSDSELLTSDLKQLELRPEAFNLMSILANLTENSIENVAQIHDGKTFSVLKDALADVLIDHLAPIRLEMVRLLDNEDYLRSVLKSGADKANIVGAHTMQDVKKALNLLS
jgi:tryptophanyl-tRNA synthetase